MPKGFDDPSRRLTPHSARRIVTNGAAEIAVDDFVDTFLRERPKTLPELALPPDHPALLAATVRPPGPGATPPPSEPPLSAEALPAGEEEILRELADKTDRISELEGELERMKVALETAKRQSSSDLEGPRVDHPMAMAPIVKTAPMPMVVAAPAEPAALPRPEPKVEETRPPAAPPSGEPRSGPVLSVHPIVEDPSTLAEVVSSPRPRARRSPVVAIAFAVLGLGGALAYAGQRGLLHGAAAPPSPPSAMASGAPAATAHSSTPTSRAAETAAPAAARSAAPVASAVASAASAPAADAPDDPADLQKLLSFQAYLTVKSSADAAVVVQGTEVGRTNQRLMVRCGPRNVRLRGADGGWLSHGDPVQITCMQHTRVAIEPTDH